MTDLSPGCQPQDCCGDPSAHLPARPAPAIDRTDRVAVIYDALAGLQGGPHHLPPGTRQAVAEHLVAVLPAPDQQTAEAVCICGHPEQRHFEDVCQTCGCGDYLEPRDAVEVIARWRQAALQARAELRRLAGEAQQDEAREAVEYARALATPPLAEAAAYIRDRLAARAREAQQDATQDGEALKPYLTPSGNVRIDHLLRRSGQPETDEETRRG